MVWLQSPIFLPLFLFHSQWTIKAMVHLLRTVSVYCFKISHTTPSLFIQSEGFLLSLISHLTRFSQRFVHIMLKKK